MNTILSHEAGNLGFGTPQVTLLGSFMPSGPANINRCSNREWTTNRGPSLNQPSQLHNCSGDPGPATKSFESGSRFNILNYKTIDTGNADSRIFGQEPPHQHVRGISFGTPQGLCRVCDWAPQVTNQWF